MKDGFFFDSSEIPQSNELSRRFYVPPFSVLNARGGWWQKRKRWWLRLGIRGEVGRVSTSRRSARVQVREKPTYRQIGGGKHYNQSTCSEKYNTGEGTSVFDPVLCELMYRWFCPPGGLVLDPFAGGSVRGIVAHKLGYRYWGSELRKEQVEANRIQAADICPDDRPVWVCGDSQESLSAAPKADLIFTCPPYGNLERYGDDPRDLSTMDYPDFLKAYRRILSKACDRLKENRFAVVVVAEFRDQEGHYHNFVGDTVRVFQRAGLHYYNECILVTAVGSLPIRVTKIFEASRKLGKTHQNVLMFVKGDVRKLMGDMR